jgi:Flp pilus assembly protein TadG
MVHSATQRNRSITSRGQMMVLLALLIPVLMGAVALGVDISIFYFNWAQLQNAADASALAGAGYLPGNPTQAVTTAKQYAAMNGIANGEISSIVSAPNNQSITVGLKRTVPYYFAKVIGLTSSPVSVSATASLQNIGSAIGIVPIGVQFNTAYTKGQQMTIYEGVAPGNWGALALGGSGASTFSDNLANGYQANVNVNDLLSVQTKTGVMDGPVKRGIDARISAGMSADPGGTFSSHTLDDARVMLVPMVDFAGIAGSSQVPVKGFAEVWLVGISGGGSTLGINVVFIDQVVPKARPGNGQSFGAWMVVLTS